MTDHSDAFEEVVDFLVVGSGAGGLCAALTANARGLSTLVIEKNPHFGGSSALSGGGIWVPGAPVQRRAGFALEMEPVLEYLKTITKGIVSEQRLKAYLTSAPEMMGFLERISKRTAFVWKSDYPDYFPEVPGGSTKGSLVNVEPIDLKELGADASLLLAPHGIAPRGVWLGPKELVHFYRMRQTWTGKATFLKVLWRMIRARLTGERIATGGQALMVRLMLAFREQGIRLWLESPMRELIADEQGNVIGAVISKDGRDIRVRSRFGVLLATGGFEHNAEMRQTYQPAGKPAYTLGNRGSTGDGIRAAEQVGAALATMDSAWWYPAIVWKNGSVQFSLNERMMPAQLIVNGAGQRYINEATPYSEFGFTMIAGEAEGTPHIPSWLITDDASWRRYVIFGHLPLPKIPFAPAPTGHKLPAGWEESGSVRKAGSIAELAEKIGVPKDGLVRTVGRYNEIAASGRDADFRRGDSAYDGLFGDITRSNPSLAPLGDGPYYAFKLILSDLGTNGGILTDEHARAVRADGSVIAGLYATGNTSSAVMGRSYAGAGATLGPAMTFGYIASNRAAEIKAFSPQPGPRP